MDTIFKNLRPKYFVGIVLFVIVIVDGRMFRVRHHKFVPFHDPPIHVVQASYSPLRPPHQMTYRSFDSRGNSINQIDQKWKSSNMQQTAPMSTLHMAPARETSYQSLGEGTTCPPPPDHFKATYHNGNCYYYSCVYFSTWFAAMTECQREPLGGHLVTILDENEGDGLMKALRDPEFTEKCTPTFFNPRIWIGLTLYERRQAPMKNGLMWSDADAQFPIPYENWAKHQPNDLKGKKLCASMSVDTSEWSLESCSDENFPFVCKVESGTRAREMNYFG